MSYELTLSGSSLDLELARRVLQGDPDFDEVLWARDCVSATVVLDPAGIGVGVYGDEAPCPSRASDFRELLELLVDLAERMGASLYDPQMDRELSRADIEDAVADFG